MKKLRATGTPDASKSGPMVADACVAVDLPIFCLKESNNGDPLPEVDLKQLLTFAIYIPEVIGML